MTNPVFERVASLAWKRFEVATEQEGQEPEEAFRETVIIMLEEQERRFLQLRGGVAH